MGGLDRLKVDLDGLEQFASSLENIRKPTDGTRKLFDAVTSTFRFTPAAGEAGNDEAGTGNGHGHGHGP